MGGWAAAGAAAASLAGGFLQRREDRKTLSRQFEFQERMSSTAYQRSMADMRKAGLNPILAYKTGGASTPTGASYKAQNIIGQAASSAASTYQMIKQTDNVQADTALKVTQTSKTMEEARKAKQEADLAEQYGPSALGRNIGSIERMIRTLLKQWDANSAKSQKRARSKIKVENLPPFGSRQKERSTFQSIMKKLRNWEGSSKAFHKKVRGR